MLQANTDQFAQFLAQKFHKKTFFQNWTGLGFAYQMFEVDISSFWSLAKMSSICHLRNDYCKCASTAIKLEKGLAAFMQFRVTHNEINFCEEFETAEAVLPTLSKNFNKFC